MRLQQFVGFLNMICSKLVVMCLGLASLLSVKPMKREPECRQLNFVEGLVFSSSKGFLEKLDDMSVEVARV